MSSSLLSPHYQITHSSSLLKEEWGRGSRSTGVLGVSWSSSQKEGECILLEWGGDRVWGGGEWHISKISAHVQRCATCSSAHSPVKLTWRSPQSLEWGSRLAELHHVPDHSLFQATLEEKKKAEQFWNPMQYRLMMALYDQKGNISSWKNRNTIFVQFCPIVCDFYTSRLWMKLCLKLWKLFFCKIFDILQLWRWWESCSRRRGGGAPSVPLTRVYFWAWAALLVKVIWYVVYKGFQIFPVKM